MIGLVCVCLLIGVIPQNGLVMAVSGGRINLTFSPSSLTLCEGDNRTISVQVDAITASEDAGLSPPFPFTLVFTNGSANFGQHFSGSIPTNNVSFIPTTDDFATTFNITITVANSLSFASPLNFTIEGDPMSINAQPDNMYTDDSVLPSFIWPQVTPGLSVTLNSFTDSQINVTAATSATTATCLDPFLSFTLSLSNLADNSMTVSATYDSPPQGVVLSGLRPSTRYDAVLTGVTSSRSVVHTNAMSFTTLPSVPIGVLDVAQRNCSLLSVSWAATSPITDITFANINYNRVSDANVTMVTSSLSGNLSDDVALNFTEMGDFDFQVQLVSSDGRSGNFSSPQTFTCSGAGIVTKSIIVAMCVAMAIMATIF